MFSNRLSISLLRAGPELRDDAAFDAVANRHPEHGAALLRSIRAMVQDNIGDAADQLVRAPTFDSGEALSLHRGFLLLILREAARPGFGECLLRRSSANRAPVPGRRPEAVPDAILYDALCSSRIVSTLLSQNCGSNRVF